MGRMLKSTSCLLPVASDPQWTALHFNLAYCFQYSKWICHSGRCNLVRCSYDKWLLIPFWLQMGGGSCFLSGGWPTQLQHRKRIASGKKKHIFFNKKASITMAGTENAAMNDVIFEDAVLTLTTEDTALNMDINGFRLWIWVFPSVY